jgi:hypothetical protein
VFADAQLHCFLDGGEPIRHVVHAVRVVAEADDLDDDIAAPLEVETLGPNGGTCTARTYEEEEIDFTAMNLESFTAHLAGHQVPHEVREVGVEVHVLSEEHTRGGHLSPNASCLSLTRAKNLMFIIT